MADTKKPTAANIISSLGVKGAIASIPQGVDPAAYAQFVPMLDADGKLSVDFIPSSVVEKVVRPITNVVIVDPNTEVDDDNRSGSAVAPFKNLHEAAANVGFDGSKHCAILLMPGKYSGNDNAYMEFKQATAGTVVIIGIGDVELATSILNIYGQAVSGGKVYLQNVSTNNSIQVYYSSSVMCLGRTYVGGKLLVGQITLKLSSESRIASTDARTVQYLSELSYIGNTSAVPGVTAKDALDRLDARKIRIAKLVLGESGIDVGGSSYEDLSATSDSGTDIYDLRKHDQAVVGGVRKLQDSLKNLVSETVTAKKIVADEIQVNSLKMNALTLGGYKLGIDAYGYLVILDGDSAITPPKGVILIEDTGSSGNGEIYAISVSNGRLNVGIDAGESSSPEVLQALTVVDARTGEEYEVTMVNGRLEIVGTIGSDSTPDNAPRLWAIDEGTGKYHQVVAVTADGRTTLKVVQDGISDVELAAIQKT